MLKIRLKRLGAKKTPAFRIIVINSTTKREGRPIQELGHYNPKTKVMKFDKDSALEWIKKGAQPTETVQYLIDNCNADGSLNYKKKTEKKLSKKAIAKLAAEKEAKANPKAEIKAEAEEVKEEPAAEVVEIPAVEETPAAKEPKAAEETPVEAAIEEVKTEEAEIKEEAPVEAKAEKETPATQDATTTVEETPVQETTEV